MRPRLSDAQGAGALGGCPGTRLGSSPDQRVQQALRVDSRRRATGSRQGTAFRGLVAGLELQWPAQPRLPHRTPGPAPRTPVTPAPHIISRVPLQDHWTHCPVKEFLLGRARVALRSLFLILGHQTTSHRSRQDTSPGPRSFPPRALKHVRGHPKTRLHVGSGAGPSCPRLELAPG